MKVAIIGAGNVATHLAKALHNADIEVLSIWSNQVDNAKILAQQVNADAVNTIHEIAKSDSDVIFIAVKDDKVAEIVEQLKSYKGIVLHTAGAIAMDILNTFENHGVFYPLQTFSKAKSLNFSAVPICLEANNLQTLNVLEKLCIALNCKYYSVSSEKRSTLHVAAVFACNFPNYLYQISADILAKDGLDFDIIRPLIAETAQKVQIASPADVQTGPAIRNDQKTMDNHLQLLKTQPEWLAIYKLLSEQIKNSR